MEAMHRCAYMKINVVYGRNSYFYVLIWNISGSSTRGLILFMSFHSFRFVNRHTISITGGRSIGLPYQCIEKPMTL